MIIPASLLGTTVSGDAFGLTFYTKPGHRVVVYPAAPPKKPPSLHQIVWRARFGNAMRAWRALSELGRQAYRDLAFGSKIPMLGHNIWISLCLRPTFKIWETLCRQSLLPLPKPVLC
jgi:hypothetical protein